MAFPQEGGCGLKKDLYLKRYLSDKRRFADLINGFVADGRELLTAAELTGMGSQSESTRTQQYRDRLYRAAFGVNFLVIGVEGQEKTHYLMPVRCMSYDSTEYERQTIKRRREVKLMKNVSSGEWLSGFRKQDRLKPCVTLVLYFGEQWDGAKSLHELLDFTDIPEELRELVNDYRVHILEVQKLEDTSVFHTDVKQVFDAVRFSKDPEKLRELFLRDPAFRELDIEAYNVIVQYTRAGDLLTLREKHKKGETVDMCQALTMIMEEERNIGMKEGEKVGMRKGKAAGLREGKCEGKATGILDLLSEHSAVPETLSDRILAEKDLSVLTGWLKLAAKAETLEDFVNKM